MNSSLKLAIALVFIAPLAAQAVPMTNLIKNGSFELPTINNNSWTVLPGANYLGADNTDNATRYMADWDTDLTSGVEVRRNVAGVAQEGLNFIELDTHYGTKNGATFDSNSGDNSTKSWISQTVNTSAYQLYRLSYWYSPRAGTRSGDNQINVFWNGVQLGDGTYTNSGSGSGQSGNWTNWQRFEFDVVGNGSTGTLRFADASSPNTYGGSLDNVSLVAAVPEPETYALMMAGLGAVAFMARRRRPK